MQFCDTRLIQSVPANAYIYGLVFSVFVCSCSSKEDFTPSYIIILFLHGIMVWHFGSWLLNYLRSTSERTSLSLNIPAMVMLCHSRPLYLSTGKFPCHNNAAGVEGPNRVNFFVNIHGLRPTTSFQTFRRVLWLILFGQIYRNKISNRVISRHWSSLKWSSWTKKAQSLIEETTKENLKRTAF